MEWDFAWNGDSSIILNSGRNMKAVSTNFSEFSQVNIVFTLEGRVVHISIERFPTPKIWAMAYRFPERYLRSCTFRYLLIFRDCFCRTPSMKLDNQPRFAYVGKIHSLKKNEGDWEKAWIQYCLMTNWHPLDCIQNWRTRTLQKEENPAICKDLSTCLTWAS